MWVFLSATLGTCVLIVIWALGITADVGGLAALGILGLGILAQMADRGSADEES
jgi:hypothetical protein